VSHSPVFPSLFKRITLQPQLFFFSDRNRLLFSLGFGILFALLLFLREKNGFSFSGAVPILMIFRVRPRMKLLFQKCSVYRPPNVYYTPSADSPVFFPRGLPPLNSCFPWTVPPSYNQLPPRNFHGRLPQGLTIFFSGPSLSSNTPPGNFVFPPSTDPILDEDGPSGQSTDQFIFSAVSKTAVPPRQSSASAGGFCARPPPCPSGDG